MPIAHLEAIPKGFYAQQFADNANAQEGKWLTDLQEVMAKLPYPQNGPMQRQEFYAAWAQFVKDSGAFAIRDYEYIRKFATQAATLCGLVMAWSMRFDKAFTTLENREDGKLGLPLWITEHEVITENEADRWATHFEGLLQDWHRARNELCILIDLLPQEAGLDSGCAIDVSMSDIGTEEGSLPTEVTVTRYDSRQETYTISLIDGEYTEASRATYLSSYLATTMFTEGMKDLAKMKPRERKRLLDVASYI